MEEKLLGFVMETGSNFRRVERTFNTHQKVINNQAKYMTKLSRKVGKSNLILGVGLCITVCMILTLQDQIDEIKAQLNKADVGSAGESDEQK